VPLFALSDELIFPSPFLADEDGLLAIGGDLTPERLMLAYSMGIFPWYSHGEPIMWHAPNPRFVLFPEKIKISKSMKQLIRQDKYSITVNKTFPAVMKFCENVRRKDQEGTWITHEMKKAYCRLNELGHATSIEVWNKKTNWLVGGLYGVHIDDVFFGESMFHTESNTSKLALIYLAANFNYKIIDCQVHTEHLESMGAEYIPLHEFLQYLPYGKKQTEQI
jgi:leucyl/phenylalanyl-tRNA---protein transferase